MYLSGFGADDWQAVAARTGTLPGGSVTKLPVPVATAAPVVDVPYPEEPGVPTWIWIAGGLAVVGAGAYFATRK